MEKLKKNSTQFQSTEADNESSVGFLTIESDAQDLAGVQRAASSHLKDGCDVVLVQTESGTFIVDKEQVFPYGRNAPAILAIINNS